jgi:hypothetical protein
MKFLIGILVALTFIRASADDSVKYVTVHDGRSYAIEAAIPELEKKVDSYTLRESWWNGFLKQGEIKVIKHQLYARNEYWFWIGLSDVAAKVSINIYDMKGRLVEAESWKKGHVAGARVKPEYTGTFLIRIKVEDGQGSVPWAMIYGYR